MYKEVHPYFYDSMLSHSDVRNGNERKDIDYYHKALPRVIKLEDIKQAIPEKLPDGTGEFVRLKISDDYHEDILISVNEGEEIKKKLLSNSNGLQDEVSRLTVAVRDLTNLLRARLH